MYSCIFIIIIVSQSSLDGKLDKMEMATLHVRKLLCTDHDYRENQPNILLRKKEQLLLEM